MKLSLGEIWGFMDLAPIPDVKDKDVQWLYELVAGEIKINHLTDNDIRALREDGNYDTELLPSIFTYREVLWQPNVYTQPSLCIPQLNVLRVFCEEYNTNLKNGTSGVKRLYKKLLEGLGKYCKEAHDRIAGASNAGDVRIPTILGDLRKNAFPIIKFFLFHPKNRPDYRTDAMNRLNYAVKIMLTQYNNKYHDLVDPYWTITKGKLPTPEELQQLKRAMNPSAAASGNKIIASPIQLENKPTAPKTNPEPDKPGEKKIHSEADQKLTSAKEGQPKPEVKKDTTRKDIPGQASKQT